MKILGVILSLSALTILTSCADHDLISDARYLVVRVDVIQGKPGNNEPAAPFKVALVTGFESRTRMYIEEGNFSNCEHLAPSCGHEAVNNKQIAIEDWGYVSLDDKTLKSLKVGEPYNLISNDFALRNVLSYSAQASIYKIDDMRPAKLTISLLKECPATISSVNDSVLKFEGGGIISIPTLKKIYWTQLKAECMEQADFNLSIPN